MNFLYYLKYFYFIARNWNIRLAFFTVYHEIKGEKKYNIHTVKINDLTNEKIGSHNLLHASIYQGSNYYLLQKAFEYLKNEVPNGSVVDFGSGKGRILVVAAHYGYKKITGIEFSDSLCAEAENNIAKIKSGFAHTDFQIICDDAVNYAIKNEDSLFFFFNPFDETVMLQVVKNILFSLKQKPRKVFVVYINPLYKEIFLSAGFEEEYYVKKMEYLEFSILSKEAEK
jgi:SAM-dependent methyltransferase